MRHLKISKDVSISCVEWSLNPSSEQRVSVVANLRFRLTVIPVGLVLIALALGWFAPVLITSLPDQVTTIHLLAAMFVFVGLCSLGFYTLMERALNPVVRLIDTFTHVRSGNLNPRLTVEGPEEMRLLARGFNDMVEELESQIRDIEVEKQSAERGRHFLEEQLSLDQRFRWAINAAPVGIVVSDSDHKAVYQNPASESGFLQLESFGYFHAQVLGASISSLYPDPASAASILSDLDRLPYDADVMVGPHRLHFLATPTFDEDEEFAGILLIWEEVEREDEDDADEPETFEELAEEDYDTFDFNVGIEPVDPEAGIDEDVLAEVEALEASADIPFEMVDEEDVVEGESVDAEQPVIQNGYQASNVSSAEVERSSKLVQRSVSVLAERLGGVCATVGALCDEGESLRRTIEEIRDFTKRAQQAAGERAESLFDLVDDRQLSADRKEEASGIARSLKDGLVEANELGRSVDRLRGSIEHLVVSSRVELGRLGEGAAGLSVIVDAIGDLGEEARRLGESANSRIGGLSVRLDDVIDFVKEEGRHTKSGERLEARAQKALSRIQDGFSETDQRNDLLSEMAQGQAEIAQHIAKQIKELSDLVVLTSKVAVEQVEIVESEG
jgi:methyl-accepting chemotaxis protein